MGGAWARKDYWITAINIHVQQPPPQCGLLIPDYGPGMGAFRIMNTSCREPTLATANELTDRGAAVSTDSTLSMRARVRTGKTTLNYQHVWHIIRIIFPSFKIIIMDIILIQLISFFSEAFYFVKSQIQQSLAL